MNDLPLDIKRAIRAAAIRPMRERFIESRYPQSYADDFLCAHPGIVPAEIRRQLVIIQSRSDAAQAKELWAKKLQVAERVLAEELANAYLVEHGLDRSLP